MKKLEPETTRSEPELAAIGLEAEFLCLLDDEPVDPKDAFGDPRAFLGPDAMHRVGSSYHLDTGGAVYFDTGVIELVTPVIELEPGSPSQVVRSLWEGIMAVRAGLDRWAEDERQTARIVGFSSHYNVSVPDLGPPERINGLAWLLVHLLPFPTMLFTANRRSTGVGVRPRPGRIEVTVDFTPDPALMSAATALIAAAVQETSGWGTLELAEAGRRGYPIVASTRPVPHTSRKGWLAQARSFERDPFLTPPDERCWTLEGDERAEVSLREVAARTAELLRPRLRAIAEPETVEFMDRVLHRRHPSLLDFDDRPASYEDVGRICRWQERDPKRPLPRSLYERVMRDATRRKPLVTGGRRWRPVGTEGWTKVLYESDDGQRRAFSVDELVRLRLRK